MKRNKTKPRIVKNISCPGWLIATTINRQRAKVPIRGFVKQIYPREIPEAPANSNQILYYKQ